MAWLYVPGVECSKQVSALSCPNNIELYVLSNGKPTPRPLSWTGWKKRPWVRRLSGTTLKPSTANRGVESWISSLADTRASHSVTPASVKANAIRAISGLTSAGLFGAFNRASVFSRTSEATLPGVSIPSKATFKKMVTELRMVCSRLHISGPHIVESVFLSSRGWPTPAASAAVQGQNSPDGKRGQTLIGAARGQAWPTPKASDGPKGGPNMRGSKGELALPSAVFQTWPTPTVCGNHNARGASQKAGDGLSTAAKKWATPTSRDHKGGANWKNRTRNGAQRKQSDMTLPDQLTFLSTNGRGLPAQDKSNSSGNTREQLNPAWVEQLMGWLPGLTEFTCSETAWCLWLRLWRSWLFGVDCSRSSNSVAA